MKKIIFLILIAVLIGSVAYYTGESVFEKSPVMYVDLSIVGEFENPVFDVNNTSRTVEMVPIIKQNRDPGAISANSIVCGVFYDRQKIGNSIIVPYQGPGNYSLTFTFKDDVRLPTSDKDFVNIQFKFLNEGEVFATKFLLLRWDNLTESQ